MSGPADEPMPAACEEQAADWCWRVAEGALTPEEQQAFDAWLLADPVNRQTFERMVTVWQGSDALAELPGFLSLRAKALKTMENARQANGSARPSAKWYAAVAAAAACLLMVVGGYWWLSVAPQLYQTGIGERRVVRLEDGSHLSLDAATAVEVAYSSDRRTLTLEHGRAKFDVAKDPLRPFTVTAAGKTIVATGTSFSVELLHDQVRVFLYEGHVAVLADSDPKKPGVPLHLARQDVAADQSLTPGSELVTQAGSASAVVERGDVDRSLSWEGGRLSFIDEPLSSAVERVNRYADTPIVIDDPVAGRYLINGVFNAGDTRSFVSGVASLYPIAVRRDGNRIRLSSEVPEPGEKQGRECDGCASHSTEGHRG